MAATITTARTDMTRRRHITDNAKPATATNAAYGETAAMMSSMLFDNGRARTTIATTENIRANTTSDARSLPDDARCLSDDARCLSDDARCLSDDARCLS